MSMTKTGERKVEKNAGAQGGAGYILKEALISEEERGEGCGLFAKIILKPGCEIGYHQHNGNTETYYILKGKGTYNDNGTTYMVEAGDVTYCKEGDWHGLVNDSTGDIEMIALILNK